MKHTIHTKLAREFKLGEKKREAEQYILRLTKKFSLNEMYIVAAAQSTRKKSASGIYTYRTSPEIVEDIIFEMINNRLN